MTHTVLVCEISIHAPAKGATGLLSCTSVESADFNPRSREGSDNFLVRTTTSIYISIHAPAKGATCFYCYILRFINYFNPRSREGSDNERQFISEYYGNFNPRSREGSDNGNEKMMVYEQISIHAPAKGATKYHLT